MYTSDTFSIYLETTKSNSAHLKMQIHNSIVSTAKLPHTYEFLKFTTPNVLNSECFNEKNLPFYVEVKDTELGHLFEHILLEKLCNLKLASGSKNATFSGKTFWDWKKNPYGHFDIKIKIQKRDFDLLKEALFETISIFNSYLQYNSSSQRTNALSSRKELLVI